MAGDKHNGASNVVATNDVMFALHAVLVTLVGVVQVYMYRKPDERVWKLARGRVVSRDRCRPCLRCCDD